MMKSLRTLTFPLFSFFTKIHSYSDSDDARLPTWIKSETNINNELIWSEGSTGSKQQTPGAWETGSAHYIAKLSVSSVNQTTVINSLKTLKPNTLSEYWDAIEHIWYRDGEYFVIPSSDQVVKSSFHYGNSISNWPSDYKYTGQASSTRCF